MRATTMIGVLLGVGSLIGLAGCATPASTHPTAAPTHSASPSPSPKTALEAKHALFDATNLQTIRSASPAGAAFLDGLTAAGFPADTLEATTDLTSAGLTAPSIQFSALVDATCLIGQYGPDGTGYRSMTAPPIVTGRCLIGAPGGPSTR